MTKGKSINMKSVTCVSCKIDFYNEYNAMEPDIVRGERRMRERGSQILSARMLQNLSFFFLRTYVFAGTLTVGFGRCRDIRRTMKPA
jgi:hypothetical protein